MANKVIGHIPYSLGLRAQNPSKKNCSKQVSPTAVDVSACCN